MNQVLNANNGQSIKEKKLIERKENTKRNIKYIKENYQLYLLVAPAVILTLIFKYIPMYGVVIAFKDYNPMEGIIGSAWVGFKHFSEFLTSPNFWSLFENTFKLSFYGLLIGFPIPIIIALMLNYVKRDSIKKKIQLVLYAPNFISVIVVCGMIFIFLSPTGPINSIITAITGQPVMFMTNPDYFRTIYILSGVWQGAGWASILYVAALSGVSQDSIDAATVDGANIFHKIRYIDIPAIKHVMAIQLILSVGGIMAIGFEKAYLLQTSMNMATSEILPTYVYRIGLMNGDYAFSAAVGLFNTVINLALLVVVNKTVKKLNDGQGI